MRAAKTETPFIIWTLQRTGGTNLSSFLNRMSACERLRDEPFNGPRDYGHITKAWRATRDDAALRAGVAEVVALRRNIKHCVEEVPWSVSKALLDLTIEAGWNHLVLYRGDRLQRLLSLEYAARTRSWGPKSVMEDGQDAFAFEQPLDADALAAHELACGQKLRNVWRQLRAGNASAMLLTFEDLYSAPAEQAMPTLKRLLAQLGIKPTGEKALASIFEDLREAGDQKTRDRYDRFVGLDDLRARLAEIHKEISFQRDASPETVPSAG